MRTSLLSGAIHHSVQGEKKMASTHSIRQGQIEIGVIEHEGHE
jgi:hypothetical protein